MARFRVTTENLRFCEVWPSDGYGLIRNATGKDSDDGALTFYDRFRVTEILEEVSSIFGYFCFGTSAYLHWKLPYCTALFFRTDFTVAWVFQKRSTTTIHLPRLEFGRRTSRLRKFGTRIVQFKARTDFSSGTHLPPLAFKTALGLSWDPFCCPHPSPTSSLPLLSHLGFFMVVPPPNRRRSITGCPQPITPVEEA